MFKFVLLCTVISLASAGTHVNLRVRRQGLGAVGAPATLPVAAAEKLLTATLENIAKDHKDFDIIVKEVLSATMQVVAGSNSNILANLSIKGQLKKNCTIQIREQSWVEKDGKKGGQTTITCPGHDETYTHKVAKRQVPGGEKPVPNEEALALVNKYFKVLKAGPTYSVIEIKKARVQTVSGLFHTIEVLVKSKDGKTEPCHLTVWQKPWEKTDDAVEITSKCETLGENNTYHSKYIE